MTTKPGLGFRLQPLLQNNSKTMFTLQGTGNIEAVPEVKDEHRSPLVIGLRAYGLVTLLLAPAVLPTHQFGGDAVAPEVGMNTAEPTVVVAGLTFIT